MYIFFSEIFFDKSVFSLLTFENCFAIINVKSSEYVFLFAPIDNPSGIPRLCFCIESL